VKSNGILTGTSEIAVCAHARYKFGWNSAERRARHRANSGCNASQLQGYV